MHDWTRVSAGTFHDFHDAWITHIKEALNAGLLPDPYYALGEQRTGDFGPDVLTLKAEDDDSASDESVSAFAQQGVVALAASPPQVFTTQEAVEDVAFYLERQRAVVIRHASGDRVVAIIEIVSRANRHSQRTLGDFVDRWLLRCSRGFMLW